VNPLGLVPALEYHGRPLRESTVICEFLEDAFPERGPHLLPTDAYERARVRLAVDHISKKVIPAFFQTLQAPAEGEERADARSALYDALRTLAREVKGPYLVGEELSLADVAIAPFVVRDYVLRDHRGYVRADVGHGWEAYAARLEGRESVRRTSSVSRGGDPPLLVMIVLVLNVSNATS
jgi:glutathione S-transferase